MGEYEELVELGFEGVDKAVDKYHDKVWEKSGKHSAGWHRRHDHKQPQQPQNRRPSASESSRSRKDTPRSRDDSSNIESDRDMYASDRRFDREYQERRDRDRGDSRYVSDDTFYYRGPDAGAVAMRGSVPFNYAQEHEIQQYQQPQYDNRRPQPQRRRSSWSPQRSGRDRGSDRRVRSRSRSRLKDRQHRIAATVAGGLIGGLLANQVQKGKKFDTAATVVGAVVGGLGAREISEQWDKRQGRREEREEKWEERFGDHRDRRRNDRDGRNEDRRRYNDRD